MRIPTFFASILLGAGALGAIAGCGSTGDGGSGSGSSGGSLCGSSTPVSYTTCSGTSFTNDGSCAAGACATGDLAMKIFAAWRAKTLALSGLSEQELDKRVSVSTVDASSGSFVRIEYIVVLDWARSRQADSVSLDGLSATPTDAEIEKAVSLAIEAAEWTGLGALAAVAPESKVQAAFDGCQCDISIDWCHIDFMNVSGKFTVRGFKEINAASNECLQATVDVGSGDLVSCDPTPCEIN
jgi:hypothetical protein